MLLFKTGSEEILRIRGITDVEERLENNQSSEATRNFCRRRQAVVHVDRSGQCPGKRFWLLLPTTLSGNP